MSCTHFSGIVACGSARVNKVCYIYTNQLQCVLFGLLLLAYWLCQYKPHLVSSAQSTALHPELANSATVDSNLDTRGELHTDCGVGGGCSL